jgi:threonylcarbamoyladenosine tRNA methylthiotransferase MtaB
VKKFVVSSLGCRTNQYESQAISSQLESLGYTRANSAEDVDLCIINTCAVTASAVATSRHEIRAAARKYPKAKIVVTGCFAEQDALAVESLEGVTAVVPNKDKERLVQKIIDLSEPIDFCVHRFDEQTRAFLKIQDGCDCFCSYCIVPFLRGRSRSRNKDEIMTEARRLVDSGHSEIVIVGVNIGDFKNGSSYRLSHLLYDLSTIPQLRRLRLSSINAHQVDEELLSVMSGNENICPSLHLVLQSGSDAVLSKMNRQYTKKQFLEVAHRAQECMPECALTTDVIVGFPGETEEDFQETIDVIRKIQCAKAHIFPYSERAGTRAVDFPDKIPVNIIQQRKSLLASISQEVASLFRKRFVGKTMTVLTESSSLQSGTTQGLLHNGLSVTVTRNIDPNTFVQVKLREEDHSLLGDVS